MAACYGLSHRASQLSLNPEPEAAFLKSKLRGSVMFRTMWDPRSGFGALLQGFMTGRRVRFVECLRVRA